MEQLFVNVFAKVANVKVKALNPTSLGKNIAEEVARRNVFLYSYLCVSFAVTKNAEI